MKPVQWEEVKNLPDKMGMKFTGEGGVRVKDFLKWMDSWFATMGDDWTRGTTKSNAMRVGQIHVACPIHSAAGKFIRALDDDVYWSEELLRQALIKQFHDTEREEHLDEDVLSSMSTLRQGSQDVFQYSRKVLKLLRRKPSSSRQYDRVLVSHYLNGLKNQHLRGLAVLEFRRRDSRETPSQVVKEVMRLATELKIKGYRKHGGKDSDYEDDTENDDDDDDDDDDIATSDDDGDDDDDDDDVNYYGQSRRKRTAKRLSKDNGSSKRKGKEKKTRRGHGEAAASSGEVQELREMMRNMMKMQKSTLAPGTRTAAGHIEAGVIPLDTYAIRQGHERRPYNQTDRDYSTTRRPEYSNGHRRALQYTEYRRGHRWGYPVPYEDSAQATRRGGPSTRSYFEDSTRRSTESSRYAKVNSQPAGSYASPNTYENSSEPPAFRDANGVWYYPGRPLACFYCEEEGHMRSQCPRLRSTAPRMTELGPEHPDTPVAPRKVPPPPVRFEEVNAVEIVIGPLVLDEGKIHDVATIEVYSPDKMECVQRIQNGDDDDDDFEWEEEEMDDDAADDYCPGQVAEKPEN